MSAFEELKYVSTSGLTVAAGHDFDDPYLGKPMSAAGTAVMQDVPVGISWKHEGKKVSKTFDQAIQVALDERSSLLLIIGHWGSSIGEFTTPDNGVVFNPDGSIHRRILVPPRITRTDLQNVLSPDSTRVLVPEGLTLVHCKPEGIELWLSYLDGDWHEIRMYDPKTGEWGETKGQYRAV